MAKRFIITLLLVLSSAQIGMAKDGAAPAKSGRKPDLSICGSNDLATYVGQPVGTLEGKTPPNARLIPEGNAMTMDVRADRLTVIYANRSGVILKMYCG
ncbi:hypothetical protein ACVIGB_000621 [Bradyrhizobium sp. USDA 4341]